MTDPGPVHPPRLWRVAATCAVAVAAGLTGALLLGDVLAQQVIPGLPDAGQLTRVALPIARTAMDLAAILTVGALLGAAVLIPSVRGALGPVAERFVRVASWTALVWAAAAAVTLVFSVSDILGLPVGQVLGDELTSYAGSISQGVALMIVILLATAVGLFARTCGSTGAAIGLLALAVIALVPPPLTGHSATAGNHSVAVIGLACHVVAVAVWTGGLAALVLHAVRGWAGLGVAAGRFSRLALWCYLAVGVSGVAGALIRLPDLGALVGSRYGLLVIAKAVAFTALGYLGWLHRRATIPRLTARDATRGGLAFARLAAGEAALMAATVGIAVALARTAPPPVAAAGDPVRELLGYALPGPLTPARLAVLWRLDFFFAALTAALGLAYAGGLVRLRRRGVHWPAGRTIAWFLGLATVVISTMSGLATYAPVLFSAHMVQHMVLSMISPIFLALGAPVTLALRALRPAARQGDRGPREWLTAALHSPVVGVLTHPLVATALFVASTYALYFTPLFGALMGSHLGHVLMSAHFLLVGSLFFWLLVGVDPAPRRLPYLAKMIMLFATMPFHAFFGVALMSMTAPIAASWYSALGREWGPSLIDDQNTGGAIAWAFGEIPTLIVLAALVFQWARADERLARRQDRHADRVGPERDELAGYNAYLAALARGQRRAP